MARQRRTLEEQVADLSMRSRMGATQYLSTPPLPTISAGEGSGGLLIPNQAINAGMLREGSVTTEKLSEELQETLSAIPQVDARLAVVEDAVDELVASVGGPAGIVSRWTNGDLITVYDNTPIHSVGHSVPARGVLKITVNLRGTASLSGQYTRFQATADGVIFGERHHYSPSASHESNETMTFFYENEGGAKRITFTLSATAPDGGSFTIPPRAAGNPPQTEVIYEDIGSPSIT